LLQGPASSARSVPEALKTSLDGLRFGQEWTVSNRRARVRILRGKNGLTSMTVSLPSTQRDYVRKRAAATGCSTPSEYIRRLTRADQKAHEQE
jgi:hypothetical protein